MKKSKILLHILDKLLILSPLLLVLSTVFIIDNSLANCVVSGKYFWFYGNIVLILSFFKNSYNKVTIFLCICKKKLFYLHPKL